jgi:hypothetical protein
MAAPDLPATVSQLLTRVFGARSARSSPQLRRAVYDHVAALTRRDGTPPEIPAELQRYVGKVALDAYKVLDREVDAIRAAGYSVDEVFEITVAASVAAGVERMTIALAALEEK